MIMRKKKIFPSPKHARLSHITLTLYVSGMLVLAVALFFTVTELSAHTSLTVPQMKYYMTALEHILAGLTLLTGGCYLVERIARK